MVVSSEMLVPVHQAQWGMLQRAVFVNKIRVLQRTRKNTIGRSSTRVRMICRVHQL